MKYILFEKSAVEKLINESALQSLEFDLGKKFVRCIKGEKNAFFMRGLAVRVEKEGIIFCGKDVSKIFLLIDLEKCEVLKKASDAELLIVLQKTFRFSVRFWNYQTYTNCEKMFKDKTVIFPFPYSKRSSYRIVVQRNPIDKRLEARGITNSLLAYKYGEEGTSSSTDETPDLGVFRKGGEDFLGVWQELRRQFVVQKNTADKEETNAIHVIEADNMVKNSEFKYLNFDKQIQKLTLSQKKIVNCEDMDSPIRIEGPAGTGKTAALVLRAIKILRDATEEDREISISLFTHSKSTENAVKQMFSYLAREEWLQANNKQNIFISTLQEYCVNFINIQQTQIIDTDASEVKQYQLFLIQEAYDRVRGNVFNTYKALMSDRAISFFEKEEENKIIIMLQHEFSIRIKGIAEGDIERYKKLESLANGMPIENEGDKEYVFRIFREYQNSLVNLGVYDTDDIILEALARLNAPLWRRARVNDGVDYLLVDEMHLFNLNEQQVFHFLTKDGEQKKIPICFALDYAQVVGERDNLRENYIEQSLAEGQTLRQEFSTVFRSSQQIAELCASITASGALLFDSFINPYKYCESGFTAKEEELCEIPKLIMYETDLEMRSAIEAYVKGIINQYKCQASEVAVVFFDEEMLEKHFTKTVGAYEVNYIDGRNTDPKGMLSSSVVCSIPEHINGLEFKGVILVGVDEGRVPQSGISDVSTNFMKYSALNKLYLACSRAQYSVIMLGTNVRGTSSCLAHSISSGTLLCETSNK